MQKFYLYIIFTTAMFLFYGCSQDKDRTPDAVGNIEDEGHKHELQPVMNEQGEIEYYTCTMHPSVKEKESGKCPICAMDLTPVYKSQPESSQMKPEPTVAISLYQQQLIGVKKDTVRTVPLNKVVRTVGYVSFDETKIAVINLRFSGWIEKLYANYVGQYVEKGMPVFTIYSPELVSTQEEYLQLFRSSNDNFDFTELSTSEYATQNRNANLIKNTERRLRLWGLTDKQIQEINNSKTVQVNLPILSPISGYVLEKSALEGRYFNAGTDLYKIADLSTIWVHADIYEYELPFIRENQNTILSLSYNPSVTYRGRVEYIYPTIDKKSRTAKIRLVFPNPDVSLKPNMYANVELKVDLGRQIAVPQTAVLNTGTRHLVFIDKGNGRFEPRSIKVGLKVDEYYVVNEGLKPGEVVVVSGNFLIDAEAHVQGIIIQSREEG